MSFPWRVKRLLPALVLAAVVVRLLPAAWCSKDAQAWFDASLEKREALAGAVESLVLKGSLSADQFHNSHELFNGEWLFGSNFAAGVGFAQLALQHPEGREKNLGRAVGCARLGDHRSLPLSRPHHRIAHSGGRGEGWAGYISGGSLGNAILLAMLTVPRSEVSLNVERP
jgi:hypothetical protein